MRLLPDTILVQVDNVGSILDLGVFLLLSVHTKHEWEGSISVAEIAQRQVRYVQVTDMLVLEREDQTSEGLAAVD